MSIYAEPTITGTISAVAQITGRIETDVGQLTANISGGIVPKQYTGAYEFTPTEEQQTVVINGLLATQNIVINPIPHDYGHVLWNGAVLTIV